MTDDVRAFGKITRIMDRCTPDDQARVVTYFVTRYGGGRPAPLSDAERAARYRQRHANVTQTVTNNGGSPVTESVTESVTEQRDERVTPDTMQLEASKSLDLEAQTKKRQVKQEAKEILSFLNEKAGKNFRAIDTNLRFIEARLGSDVTISNCKGVIVRKVREWKTDPKMNKFLRPATLFNAEKFEQYLGEREATNAGE